MNRKTACSVSQVFGFDPISVREDISLAGSPARTVARLAIEDSSGDVFIVEEIDRSQINRKCAIARTVNRLHTADPELPTPTYREYLPGETVLKRGERFFQVVPYVLGIPLDREAYLDESWRGRVMAEFLLRMRLAAGEAGLDERPEAESFSLRDYVFGVVATMERYDPETFAVVRPIFAYLESGYFAREGELSVSFCHGDYHPVNIIWGESGLNAVIDWEFSGPKPELYDVANMVGCLGMEDPATLTQPIVTKFLVTLRREGGFSDASWQAFPDLVLALRFAWLSEWLRFREPDMVSLETTYMDMLLEHREALGRAWDLD
jgi:homoserine kinase type II